MNRLRWFDHVGLGRVGAVKRRNWGPGDLPLPPAVARDNG